MEIFYFILAWIISSYLFISFVGWATHIGMTKDYSENWGWGSYRLFKKYVNSCKWDDKGRHMSLFNHDTDSEIHASIYRFNGFGMVINNPISFSLTIMYRWFHHNRLSGNPIGKVDFKKDSHKILKRNGHYVELDGKEIFVSIDEIYGKSKYE